MLIHIYNQSRVGVEQEQGGTHVVDPAMCSDTKKLLESRPTRKCKLTQCGTTGHQLPHPTHGSTVPKHRHKRAESRAPTNPRKETAGAQSARTSASVSGPRSPIRRPVNGVHRFMGAGNSPWQREEATIQTYRARAGWDGSGGSWWEEERRGEGEGLTMREATEAMASAR